MRGEPIEGNSRRKLSDSVAEMSDDGRYSPALEPDLPGSAHLALKGRTILASLDVVGTSYQVRIAPPA
jgi:hypothetical protein